MAENPATPPNTPSNQKKTPEKLLASVVRPAFHGLKSDGKKDRGTLTKPVDSELTASTLPTVKKPGSPAAQTKNAAPAMEFIPQGPEPVSPRKPIRKLSTTRLPSKSAAALRHDPDHVHEPHLHKRHTGGYAGIFFILVIGFGFLAYTFGYLPLDQLFDQENAAIQSHNDQLVAWITHVAPIIGMAFAALLGIMLLRRVFFSEE